MSSKPAKNDTPPIAGHFFPTMWADLDPEYGEEPITDEKRGELWMMDDPVSSEDIDKYCHEWLDRCWSFYYKAERLRAEAVEARLERESLSG